MKAIKAIFKNIGSRIWFIVTAILLVLMITVSAVTTTTFRSILGTVLGGQRPILNPDIEAVYKSEYKSKNEVLEAGNKLNEELEGEGAVLLLNENNALPMQEGTKISVFGKNSVDLVLSGSGSGSGGSDGAVTLYDSLRDSGFEVNPELEKFYKSSESGNGRSSNPTLSEGSSSSDTLDIGETPISSYSFAVKSSYNEYSDAAIVVISRIGGESFDLPRFQSDNSERHYLQLDANEYALLDDVTSRFGKVVVLLNTLTSFQLDFIEEYNNMPGNPRIDAVMWIGGPGITGAGAIGKLLNGEINPSGRTVDIYSRDFTKDPTWQNFGDNSQIFNGKSSAAFAENGENSTDNNYMVAYEEGVYVGYKYYETRGYEEKLADPASTWYEDNVIYPFGYGLSYTKFEQSMTVTGSVKDGVEITVTVNNIGDVAGKDVVQLYVTLPYYRGEIEKSYVQLVDFAKTKIIQPGGTDYDTVTFKINPYDLASYDYNDANGNDKFGYELDNGNYIFYISANSHVDEYSYQSEVLTLAEGDEIYYAEDPVSHNTVENRYTKDWDSENRFDDIQYRLSDVTILTENGEVTRKGMSRMDFEGTFPDAPDVTEREYLEGERAALANKTHNNTSIANATEIVTGADGTVMLRDLFGKDYNDDLWKELLDKLTYDEMLGLVNNGAFQTDAILSIGKNLTNDSDGPVGFINFMMGLREHYRGNPSFACEIVIASTWNKDLAYQMGKIVGETGLWGDVGGNNLPYTGWYAPAVNIHRSPFSGRNYEYYSEDPVLSGKMAVNVINGAKQKGVYTDLKHFALNDQETNRAGVATYCTEQALREIYLKPFEIAVKGLDDPNYSISAKSDGVERYTGTTGIMSSFNRIGTRWTGGDYRLLTEILRNEWDFKGLVICDYKTNNSVMDSRQMLYAGNDLILASLPNLKWTDSNSSNIQDMAILREASHHILYAVANSNSINVDVIGYKIELWVELMFIVEAAIVVGLGVWGFFAIRKALKRATTS